MLQYTGALDALCKAADKVRIRLVLVFDYFYIGCGHTEEYTVFWA